MFEDMTIATNNRILKYLYESSASNTSEVPVAFNHSLVSSMCATLKSKCANYKQSSIVMAASDKAKEIISSYANFEANLLHYVNIPRTAVDNNIVKRRLAYPAGLDYLAGCPLLTLKENPMDSSMEDQLEFFKRPDRAFFIVGLLQNKTPTPKPIIQASYQFNLILEHGK